MFFTFFGNNFPRSKCETAETETPLWRPQEQFYSTKKKMHPPNPNPTAHGPKHAVLNTTEAHQLRWRQANFFFPDPKKMPHPTPAPMFHRTMSLGGSPMRVTPLQTTFGPVFEPRVYHLMAHCPRQTKRKINKKWLDFAHAAPICLPAFLSRFCRHCPHGGLTSNMCAPSIWVGGWVALCLCVCVRAWLCPSHFALQVPPLTASSKIGPAQHIKCHV